MEDRIARLHRAAIADDIATFRECIDESPHVLSFSLMLAAIYNSCNVCIFIRDFVDARGITMNSDSQFAAAKHAMMHEHYDASSIILEWMISCAKREGRVLPSPETRMFMLDYLRGGIEAARK